MFLMQRKSKGFSILPILRNVSAIRYITHGTGPSTSKRSYYEILGVNSKASPVEIKNAFLTLSKKYHPDVTNDKDAHERFVEINEAYGILSKPESRQAYDARMASGRQFGDNESDFFHRQQQQRQQTDNVDEMYRRFFEELYRRRRPAGPQQHYSGQRQESPFRDFRREPPIWQTQHAERAGAESSGTSSQADQQRTRRFISQFTWLYVRILLFIVTLQILLGFAYQDVKQMPPYSGPEFEKRDHRQMEDRWKNAVFVNRPDINEDSTKAGEEKPKSHDRL